MVIIGAGNLATHMALVLHRKGVHVVQVVNRSRAAGERLARKVAAPYHPQIPGLNLEADLFILAVSDDAIQEIAGTLRLGDRLLVHTSGSVDMSVLNGASSNVGVLYPLQTFSATRKISFSGVPICVEASNECSESRLLDLARLLSRKVQVLSSQQRKVLHMTAVFAGNFTNFMYTISEDLLRKHDIPFSLLKPLIVKTAMLAEHEDVFSRQTGPAMRGDTNIMNTHLEMLAKHGVYMEIYDLISKSIIKHKNRNGKL